MFGEIFHDRLYDIPMAPVGSGDLVLDIGANHGFTACYFAARGARVVAFEPSPDIFGRLVENVERNGLGARVQCVRAAVGSRDGRAMLRESETLGGGMSTINERFAEGVRIEYGSSVDVEVWSIGRVLEGVGNDRVRLLKLDCEGSELDILRALGVRDLARIDSLAIEYHPQAYPLAALVATISSWGNFVLYKVPPTDVENANLHVVSLDAVRAWSERS